MQRSIPDDERKITASSVGGVVAAFLASVCCIGPLLLGMIGVGVGATRFWATAAGFLKTLLPYRLWFMGAAGFCFAISFYLVYRKPAGPSNPGVTCRPGTSTPFMRRMLWTLAVVALVFILAPYWLGL